MCKNAFTAFFPLEAFFKFAGGSAVYPLWRKPGVVIPWLVYELLTACWRKPLVFIWPCPVINSELLYTNCVFVFLFFLYVVNENPILFSAVFLPLLCSLLQVLISAPHICLWNLALNSVLYPALESPSKFPSRNLLLHMAILKTVGDPIFVHYFISWKSYQRFWERTAVRWIQKAVWTVGLVLPRHERLGVWARSRERAETWCCIMGSFYFSKRWRCVSRSSGHSERVQRAVGASNVRMFLAFKGLVHLEDWGLFFPA